MKDFFKAGFLQGIKKELPNILNYLKFFGKEKNYNLGNSTQDFNNIMNQSNKSFLYNIYEKLFSSQKMPNSKVYDPRDFMTGKNYILEKILQPIMKPISKHKLSPSQYGYKGFQDWFKNLGSFSLGGLSGYGLSNHLQEPVQTNIDLLGNTNVR